MKKFKVEYWIKSGRLVKQTMEAKSYNEVYKYIYDNNFLPLTVKYIKPKKQTKT